MKILKYLIKTVGIEVDAIGDRRRTPLHLACESGHIDAVKYLIEQGKASTTLRNAQVFNCLGISIKGQHKEIVKYLLSRPNWREMMRNAQPIKDTDAYDTPMRKLIRYMPDVALWMIQEKLIKVVGGENQKLCREIYDYEFYEDMHLVKQWYAKGAKLPPEDTSCKAQCHKLGVNVIFGCCSGGNCGKSAVEDENQTEKEKGHTTSPYTHDAYTLVRNHPLVIASEQSSYPDLIYHNFHVRLRKKIYRRFGTYWLTSCFASYIILLGVWTNFILRGKHPQYFYEEVGLNMTLDLDTCQIVANRLVSQNISEALKTDEYRRVKYTLYALFILFIIKNAILIIFLFPRIFRNVAYYLEASALVLSFVYVLDWTSWQEPVIVRCPIQYQIGAMGLLLAWINLLTYVRCIPWYKIGIYVTMLQVIFFKFLLFLPVLTIIICGFGFTYWMLLQNQTVFGTPIESLLRTSLMMFDLGYESRFYSSPDGVVYYELAYVIMMFTAVLFCVFIINLMIGLAVGEIPSLEDRGRLWREQMLYDLMSDYEIMHLQFRRFVNFVFRHCRRLCCCRKRTLCFRHQHVHYLTYDARANGRFVRAFNYIKKNFFDEQIQDTIVFEMEKQGDEKK